MTADDPRIDTALRATSASVERVGDAWRCVLRDGVALAAEARVCDGWLILDAPAPSDSSALEALPPRVAPIRDRTWEAVSWNGILHGAAKLALREAGEGLSLRAELPLDEEVDLMRRLAETWAGFMEGATVLRGEGFANHLGVAGASIPPRALDLIALVREAGWPFHERTPRRLAVDLEVPGAVHQAIVEQRDDDGTVRIFVELETDGAHPSPLALRALATMLLEANAALRFVRAAAALVEGCPRARFECVLAEGATACEIGHALAALSVACASAAREIAILLHDEAVAACFEAARAPHQRTNGPAAAGEPTKEE